MYASTWICTKTEDLLRPKTDRKMSTLTLSDSVIPIAKKAGVVDDLQI